MNKQTYAARIGKIHKKYILLRQIINLETGELFRWHVWVNRKYFTDDILIRQAIIQFKAKESEYKTKKKLDGLAGCRIVVQKQLVKISHIEVIK